MSDYWDNSPYTRDQMSEAMALVQDKENWKMPIDAIVPADSDTRLISDAVIFFTGSVPECITLPDGRVRVIAAGYYACIGS